MKNMSARARKSLKCVAIVLSVILCGGGCFLALFLRSRAIYSSDTTSYVKVDEIYNDATGAFDADNVNALLKYITGDAEITYETAMDTLNEMTSTSNDNGATTSADIRAKSVTVNGVTKSSSQDVIVRFGGLDWQVVYLSKTTEEAGEDIILTLWLANSTDTSKWSDGWYLDDGRLENPSNMYGSSYIRCVTLNAGGTYSTSSSGGTASATQSTSNKFARFTMEEVENSLTQYITTPDKMSWQHLQSAVKQLGFQYLCPNDSIDDPRGQLEGAGSHYPTTSNPAYNYAYYDKELYKVWADDCIWLPSITETGYNSSHTGMWETSTEQRQNVSSSGAYSWLRSGDYTCASNALHLYPSGGGYYRNGDVYSSRAVRPALHLNLNAVLDDIVANLPYVKVGELYDDEAGEMSEENVNVLLKYITGQADVSVDNAEEVLNGLASATKSSEDFRANAVSATGANKQAGQEIKITFGGLDWWATYLSTDTDGNAILTLWLDESQQDAFAGRTSTEGQLYGFINNSLYSDWSNDRASNNYSSSYPDNMYGRSYIRSVTLNNGGEYSTSGSAKTKATQNSNSVFARFTMEEVENSLTQYITTPSKMSWQIYQSTAVTNPTQSYYRPNDSIEDPADENLAGKWYSSSYNYKDKDGYKDWANDYLWLPSEAETGYNTSNIGLWETSTEQRQNYSSSTSNNGTVGSSNVNHTGSYNYSWLRSGRSDYAYDAFYLIPSGGGSSINYVDYSHAVRPALHLNLSKVITDVLGVQKIVLNNQGGEGASGMYISGEGFFADEALKEPITKVEVPTKAGYVFEGYYTSADGGVQMIEADGTILGSALDYQNITTLFAVWSEGNLAKYDSVGGYWYVENGKMPQSRVTDEATIEALNTSTLSGDVYEFAGMRFGSVKLSGSENEYFKFDDKWYKVEPIRWRLVYSSAQTSGYGTTEATMAILAEIVYVDAYSDVKLMGGAGYSAESVAPFMTNHINEDKFVTETRTVDLFSETLGSTTTTVSGDVFVASKEEINLFKTTANGTGETVNVGFSDLVSDYLASLGKGEYYFTRSLGNQLNNFHSLSPVGASTQIKAQQAYGIMFSTKVKGYGCQ